MNSTHGKPTNQGDHVAASGASATETERSEGGVAEAPLAASTADPKVSPNTEVVAKPHRRTFTAAYKQRILEEADRCVAPGDVGRLLRREGLYASHLTEWRRAREFGVREALEPRRRGPKAVAIDPLVARVVELERDTSALQEALRKAELIIKVQKKWQLCSTNRAASGGTLERRYSPGSRCRHQAGLRRALGVACDLVSAQVACAQVTLRQAGVPARAQRSRPRPYS